MQFVDPKERAAAGRISHEEFEPFCKWQREENRDVLIISLPEFKRNQLKVHINNRGVLKISGERSLDGSKKSKFYKEVVAPSNCNTGAIQAKFVNGQLHVILPKNPTTPAVISPPDNKPDQPEVVGASNIISDSGSVDPNAKPEVTPGEMQTTTTAPPAENGSKKVKIAGRPSVKIAKNVATLVAVLAALVAFVLYMYKSTVVED